MDALAGEMGMSKKTIYAHFGSKNALLEAVLKNMTQQINEGMTEILNAERPVNEKISGFIRFLHERMSIIHPSFFEDVRLYAPESWAIIEEFRARMIPVYFGRLLDDGLHGGLLREDLNRPLFIRILLNAVQGMMNPSFIMESGISPQSLVDGIMSILLEGILTPAGRKQLTNHKL